MIPNAQFTTDRDRAFFEALDRYNTTDNNGTFKRFSDYAEYRINSEIAHPSSALHQCPWRDASEICMLLRGAVLEQCGSHNHRGAKEHLFSLIGESYWASKLATQHLSQFP